MAMKTVYTWSDGDWDSHLHGLPELLKVPGARICRSRHFTFSEQYFLGSIFPTSSSPSGKKHKIK